MLVCADECRGAVRTAGGRVRLPYRLVPPLTPSLSSWDAWSASIVSARTHGHLHAGHAEWHYHVSAGAPPRPLRRSPRRLFFSALAGGSSSRFHTPSVAIVLAGADVDRSSAAWEEIWPHSSFLSPSSPEWLLLHDRRAALSLFSAGAIPMPRGPIACSAIPSVPAVFIAVAGVFFSTTRSAATGQTRSTDCL